MVGQGFGILLELWKVTKTVNIRVQRTNRIIPYSVIFEDKHVLTKTEAETQEYDKIAFVQDAPLIVTEIADVHVLGWGSAAPFVCSLFAVLPRAQKLVQLYYHHTRWIRVCVGFSHDGIFVFPRKSDLQVPALYINYRLRSVAHMPRRAMIYKCIYRLRFVS